MNDTKIDHKYILKKQVIMPSLHTLEIRTINMLCIEVQMICRNDELSGCMNDTKIDHEYIL